jgi:hypothetical protein
MERERPFNDYENQFDDAQNEAPKETSEPVYDLPFTLTLLEPFDLGSKRYTEIEFIHRLTVGMMKHFPAQREAQKMGHSVPLVQGMTGLPTVVVESLGMRDFDAAMKVVNYFL